MDSILLAFFWKLLAAPPFRVCATRSPPLEGRTHDCYESFSSCLRLTYFNSSFFIFCSFKNISTVSGALNLKKDKTMWKCESFSTLYDFFTFSFGLINALPSSQAARFWTLHARSTWERINSKILYLLFQM